MGNPSDAHREKFPHFPWTISMMIACDQRRRLLRPPKAGGRGAELLARAGVTTDLVLAAAVL